MSNGAGAIGSFLQGFAPAFMQAQQMELLRENQKKQDGLNTIKVLGDIIDAPQALRGPLFSMYMRSSGKDPSTPEIKEFAQLLGKIDDTQLGFVKDALTSFGLENPSDAQTRMLGLLKDPSKIASVAKEMGDASRAEKERRTLGDIAQSAEGPTETFRQPMGPEIKEQELLPSPEQRVESLKKAIDKATALGTTAGNALATQLRQRLEDLRGMSPAKFAQQLELSRQRGAIAAGVQPLPTETAKQLSELNMLVGQIGDAEKAFKPEYVGPVKSRIAGFEETFTGKISEEEVDFRATVRDMQDALLRARSGAQINEQEYARLVRFLPDVTNPPEVFMPRLRRFKRALQQMIEQKEKFAATLRGQAGGQPAGAPKPAPRPQPKPQGGPVPWQQYLEQNAPR